MMARHVYHVLLTLPDLPYIDYSQNSYCMSDNILLCASLGAFISRCCGGMGTSRKPVPESPRESYRVRRVVLHYYLVDDTMDVEEPKQLNSGMDQVRHLHTMQTTPP